MLCNICKQPLEPWEVTACEPCGEILQDSSTSALTQTEKQSTLSAPAARCSRQTNQQGARTMTTATAKPAQRLTTSVDDNRLPYGDGRRALGLHATGVVVWRDEAWYCDEMEVFSLYDAGREPMAKDVEFLRSELERIAAENDATQEPA